MANLLVPEFGRAKGDKVADLMAWLLANGSQERIAYVDNHVHNISQALIVKHMKHKFLDLSEEDLGHQVDFDNACSVPRWLQSRNTREMFRSLARRLTRNARAIGETAKKTSVTVTKKEQRLILNNLATLLTGINFAIRTSWSHRNGRTHFKLPDFLPCIGIRRVEESGRITKV